jgi:hypothetical protein
MGTNDPSPPPKHGLYFGVRGRREENRVKGIKDCDEHYLSPYRAPRGWHVRN